MKLFITIFFFIFNADLVGSVEPDEILENTELEEIAREIGRNLRCLVCQNEDIENSNADIAKDLRMLVRKKNLLREKAKKKLFLLFIHAMEILFYFLHPLDMTH